MLKKLVYWGTKNKLPERKRIRLKGYNYSETGGYFVTLCVEYGEHKFGTVTNAIMELNEAGRIVTDQFAELENYYKNVSINSFIVMPNHIHAIIMINGLIPEMSKSLPDVIKAFKSLSTKKIRAKGIEFNWQRSYNDSIIETAYGLEKIREYIINNPADWVKDAENIESKQDRKKYYKDIAESMKEKLKHCGQHRVLSLQKKEIIQ
jgi:putative transposase